MGLLNSCSASAFSALASASTVLPSVICYLTPYMISVFVYFQLNNRGDKTRNANGLLQDPALALANGYVASDIPRDLWSILTNAAERNPKIFSWIHGAWHSCQIREGSGFTAEVEIEAALAVESLWRGLFAGMFPLRTSFGPCSGEEADKLFGNHAPLKKLLRIASPAKPLDEEQVEEAKKEAVLLMIMRYPFYIPRVGYFEWPIDRMKFFWVALICRIRKGLKEKASKETIDYLNALEEFIFRRLYKMPKGHGITSKLAYKLNMESISMESITETGKMLVNGLPQVGTNFELITPR